MMNATPFPLRQRRAVDGYLRNNDWPAGCIVGYVRIFGALMRRLRIVQQLVWHFAYGTRNHKIPNMIVLLYPKWKMSPRQPRSRRIADAF